MRDIQFWLRFKNKQTNNSYVEESKMIGQKCQEHKTKFLPKPECHTFQENTWNLVQWDHPFDHSTQKAEWGRSLEVQG